MNEFFSRFLNFRSAATTKKEEPLIPLHFVMHMINVIMDERNQARDAHAAILKKLHKAEDDTSNMAEYNLVLQARDHLATCLGMANVELIALRARCAEFDKMLNAKGEKIDEARIDMGHDFIVLQERCDDLLEEQGRLTRERNETVERLTADRDKFADTVDLLNEAHAGLQEAYKNLEKDYAEVRKEREETKVAHKAALDSLSACEDARSYLEKRNEELRAQLSTPQLEDLRAKLNDVEAQLANNHLELVAVRKLANELGEENENLRKTPNALREELATMEKRALQAEGLAGKYIGLVRAEDQ